MRGWCEPPVTTFHFALEVSTVPAITRRHPLSLDPCSYAAGVTDTRFLAPSHLGKRPAPHTPQHVRRRHAMCPSPREDSRQSCIPSCGSRAATSLLPQTRGPTDCRRPSSPGIVNSRRDRGPAPLVQVLLGSIPGTEEAACVPSGQPPTPATRRFIRPLIPEPPGKEVALNAAEGSTG